MAHKIDNSEYDFFSLLTIGWVGLGRPLVDLAGNGSGPNLNVAQLINRVRMIAQIQKPKIGWSSGQVGGFNRMYGLNPNPELPGYIGGPGQECTNQPYLVWEWQECLLC